MANFPFPPKAKATEATVTESPVTSTTTTEAAPTAATKAKGVKKSGENRKKPAPVMNQEQIKQIIAMVKDHSYAQIAEAVGVTKFQVNRVLMNSKEYLRKAAEGDPVKLAKVEEFIKTHLSRPEDTLPGKGGARGGKVKNALDNVVADILASLS